MISDAFLLLRGAFSLRRCEEHSDEAISVELAGNEIATPRQVGARNDREGYYPMYKHIIKCHSSIWTRSAQGFTSPVSYLSLLLCKSVEDSERR